jgi:hypothetical protein
MLAHLKNSSLIELCYMVFGYHCDMTDMQILATYVAMT